MDVQIANYLHNSLVNGEGTRDVVFFSGCKHKCKGCHNEKAWDFKFGMSMDTDVLVDAVLKNKPMLDGVTISGGDPFFQYDGLLELCKKLKEHGFNIWVYTGFYLEELKRRNKTEIFNYIDALVDGRYIERRKSDECKYRGSENQSIILFKDGKVQQIINEGEYR